MLNTEPKENLEQACTQKVVHVCVAVIERINPDTQEKEVLIAKRPQHVHQGGLWEFPGGKVEKGESVIAALDRELSEELDIRIRPFSSHLDAPDLLSPLIQIKHSYPEKTVFLDVWRISNFYGSPIGKEGQEIRWVNLNELNSFKFPEANKPIVHSCLLPSRYFITPVYPSLLEAERGLARALAAGAELIYFRQPQLTNEEYDLWVEQLLSNKPILGAVLMYQFVSTLDKYSGAGVHLSFARSKEYKARPVISSKWLSISCHNESELLWASALSADFITLSPILRTQTHPEQAGIGWESFKRLVLKAAFPVYGLGGLSERDQRQLLEMGAQGMAGIGFWQN